ncbi:hypothetical protein LBMAG53_38840 [Planctomycetota bacterium]|nr:hypothetical protein LBMAG53_38840 [Planctomycetota bacterium]
MYAEAYVRYVALRYTGAGFDQAVFEVENEMDSANYPSKSAWFMTDNKYSTGSIEAYNGYYRLFRIWAGAVEKVAKEHPAKELFIAGPAATTYTFKYGTMQSVNHLSWMEKLAVDCARDHVRLDAVTYHEYGAALDTIGLPPGDQTLQDRSTMIRNRLDAVGLSTTRLWVTEWGADENITSPINCNEVGAAYTAAFLMLAPLTPIDAGTFLLYSDVPDGDHRWTWPAMLHGVYRKAVFNVFDLFNKLPGATCAVEKSAGWPPQVKPIASADGNMVGIILANYGRWSPGRVDLSSPRDVNLRICNVSGTYAQVSEFVIDHDHSNVWTQLISKSLPAQQKPLEKVQDYSAIVTDGTLVLPDRTLAKSAVHMWVVKTDGFSYASGAPSILSQPVSITVTAGRPATFTLSATGAATLSYQWKQGTTNVGTNSPTLTIRVAQAANTGSYTCMVTNGVGNVTSNAATLTVTPYPQ